jgi:putative ABC transport system ATP-binding protein
VREGAEVALSDIGFAVREPGGSDVTVLDCQGMTRIRSGEIVGLKGASGTGKTTLLHIIAGILNPTRGRVVVDGVDVTAQKPSARDAWRARAIGLVFQEFHLVPELGLLANVLLPQTFRSFIINRALKERAQSLIRDLELPTDNRRAGRLSRGEQQRLAIARALMAKPRLLIADEPTASLDDTASERVATLLINRAQATGATLLLASHDNRVLSRLERVLTIDAKRLVEEAGP